MNCKFQVLYKHIDLYIYGLYIPPKLQTRKNKINDDKCIRAIR